MYNKQVRIDKTAPIIHSMEIESGLDALIMDFVIIQKQAYAGII